MQTAIDPGAPAVPPQQNTPEQLEAALQDTQGNILKSHGRDHSYHLFITFLTETEPQKLAARQWLATTAAGRVTSAWTQWTETGNRAQAIRDAGNHTSLADMNNVLLGITGTFVSLLLSADGYQALGLDATKMPEDPSFLAGAKQRVTELNDPPPSEWEEPFQGDLHALLIVADDDPTRLDSVVAGITEELKPVAQRVFAQAGTAMRVDADGNLSPDGQVHEHFGFADGVSQPLFFAKDIDTARSRTGGIDKYDPSVPLAQVLLKDPGGGEHGYGSYFVYRKLKQNVPGFRAGERALALALTQQKDPKATEPTDADVALAGAYLVGRFKDGTPVVDQQENGLRTLPNNFTYDSDVNGVRCPLAAHVRKANPRGDKQRQFGVPVTEERSRRIARRGISFGPVTLDPTDADDVGLLFLCAQSSIIDQFEFIQALWANSQDFLRPRTGLDPIIGEAGPGEQAVNQPWPKEYGSCNQLDFSTNPPTETDPFLRSVALESWVTMRGGEYFFAPSLSFLTSCG